MIHVNPTSPTAQTLVALLSTLTSPATNPSPPPLETPVPRRRVTARSRRETLRSVWFVIAMTALIASLLVAGTITL